jgi:hypothetical protein
MTRIITFARSLARPCQAPERNPEQGQILDEELPGSADMAGKPPRLGSQTPVVVTRKLRAET